MLKKTRDEMYIEEMILYIRQQQERLKSCEASIEECDKQLKIIRNLKRLEKAQVSIINQQIKEDQRTLEKFKKSKGLK